LKLLELNILEQASEANHDPPKTVVTAKPAIKKVVAEPQAGPAPEPDTEPESELEPTHEPEVVPKVVPEVVQEVAPKVVPEPEPEIKLNKLTELMLEAIADGVKPKPMTDRSAASSCISGGSSWQIDVGMLTQSEIMWFYDNWAVQLNSKVVYIPEVDVKGEPSEEDICRVYIKSVDRLLPRRGKEGAYDRTVSSKLIRRKVLVAIATDVSKAVLDVVEIDREKPEVTASFLSSVWCADITAGDLNDGKKLIF
jgi:hypothetical protein